jgi:hypothetical protein
MKKRPLANGLFTLSSGGKTRTYDLWVMSPTSYQLLHPAIFFPLSGTTKVPAPGVKTKLTFKWFEVSVKGNVFVFVLSIGGIDQTRLPLLPPMRKHPL